MFDPAPVVRGYRPSRVAPFDGDNEAREGIRLSNLERYVLRASAGLPLFEESGQNAFQSPFSMGSRTITVR